MSSLSLLSLPGNGWNTPSSQSSFYQSSILALPLLFSIPEASFLLALFMSSANSIRQWVIFGARPITSSIMSNRYRVSVSILLARKSYTVCSCTPIPIIHEAHLRFKHTLLSQTPPNFLPWNPIVCLLLINEHPGQFVLHLPVFRHHLPHRRNQDFCLGGGAPGNFFFLTMFWQHSQYDSRLGFKF